MRLTNSWIPCRWMLNEWYRHTGCLKVSRQKGYPLFVYSPWDTLYTKYLKISKKQCIFLISISPLTLGRPVIVKVTFSTLLTAFVVEWSERNRRHTSKTAFNLLKQKWVLMRGEKERKKFQTEVRLKGEANEWDGFHLEAPYLFMRRGRFSWTNKNPNRRGKNCRRVEKVELIREKV